MSVQSTTPPASTHSLNVCIDKVERESTTGSITRLNFSIIPFNISITLVVGSNRFCIVTVPPITDDGPTISNLESGCIRIVPEPTAGSTAYKNLISTSSLTSRLIPSGPIYAALSTFDTKFTKLINVFAI